jgi:hypothetical protein
MSSTTEAQDSTTAQPSKSTRTSGVPKSKPSRRGVHVVLQGKGGIGKTWVASLVAQFLHEHDRTPICFDTDPVNNSFAAIAALNAQPVTLVEDDAINITAVDAMIERILKEDVDVVMDNGAASFIPLSNYLIADNVADVIDAAGKHLTIHVILVGGGSAMETASGLSAVLTQFPPTVRVVVWVNEYFGAVVIGGTRFEETNFYAKNKDRLAGVIHLRQQNPKTTGINLSAMLERKQTFAEVLADPAFHVMPKQRLTQYRRAIWEQLEAVL